MALTVTSGLSLISNEDGTSSNWDETTTSDYTEGQREGTGYVGYDVDIETNYNFDTVTSIVANVSGYHYGRWLRISNASDVDLKANGGIQLALRDGVGNESYFYVGGVDTYAGGWAYFVVDLSRTPDANNGTNAVITNASNIGVGFKMLAKSLDDNCHIDLGHYGTSGLIVTGSPDTVTYGANNSWQEVYDIVDAANLGLMAQQVGSFVLKGPVTIGDGVGILSTAFNDTDHIIFFADLPVADDFYNIKVVGNGTGTTDISFAGLINKTEGGTAAELDFSAAVNSFSYDASTSLNQGLTTFQAGDYTGDKFVECVGINANAGANLDSFVVEKSGLITLISTATLTNSNINKSTSTESVLTDALVNVVGNSFIGQGIQPPVTIYSDGSDSIATDAGTDWANVTNSDDGSVSTFMAYNGTLLSSIVTIIGTNYINADSITSVQFRSYDSGASGPSGENLITCKVYSGVELLGTLLSSNVDVTGYNSYITLTTPTGGWDAAKLKALKLEISANNDSGVTVSANFYKGEFLVNLTGGHAVKLTSIGVGSMTWDNNTSSYETGVSGSPVVPTTTGNEDIFVDVPTGTLTINVEAGATIPSIKSSGAAINVVSGQVTTTLTITNSESPPVPIQGARVLLKATGGGSIPDGTIIFNTLTDVNGQVIDIRSLAADQDVEGWSRKSTLPSPLYKQTKIISTISSSTGLTQSFQLSPDE